MRIFVGFRIAYSWDDALATITSKQKRLKKLKIQRRLKRRKIWKEKKRKVNKFQQMRIKEEKLSDSELQKDKQYQKWKKYQNKKNKWDVRKRNFRESERYYSKMHNRES